MYIIRKILTNKGKITMSDQGIPINYYGEPIRNAPQKSVGLSSRPTSYKPEYDEQILALAEKGYTINTICLTLKIPKVSFYRWIDEIEGFAELVDEAKHLAQGAMEKLAMDHQIEYKDGPKLNTGLYTFQMRNRFKHDYQESQVIVNKTEKDIDKVIPPDLKDTLSDIETKIRNGTAK